MKTANMTLDFKNDYGVIFGGSEKLIVTKSGHYALPTRPHSKIFNNVVTGANPNIILVTVTNKSKHDMTVKLHR